jgi:hypothetical protein
MRPILSLPVLTLISVCSFASGSDLIGAGTPPPVATKRIFESSYTDIADFAAFATRARASGATHIDITSSLPWSFWEYDDPNDPYPSWVISKLGLLKLTRPKLLEPYLPSEHADRVFAILEERCAVLRQLGLKATFSANEPNMLPEAVFTDHPLWRGARVDHPTRSRVARFAPTIDHPDVLALFRESMSILLRRCPEIDQVNLATNDSGAGLDWSPGLYAGRFGNTLYRDRSMDDRIHDFFGALQSGARDADASVEVRITVTREPDPARIARKLPAGTAIENLEGPNASPFTTNAGFREGYSNPFNPVFGIPRPVLLLDGLIAAQHRGAPRQVIAMGDRRNRDLYFAILDRFTTSPVDDPLGRLRLLREVAVSQVGEEHADELLRLWLTIEESSRLISLLDTGGYIFYLGCVQQRWLTRPFVPFPSELTTEEKSYYRRFQFQALDEAHAESLSDVQATDVYGGWSGRHFVRRVLDPVESNTIECARLARRLGNQDLAHRLDIFRCILRNARNAVSYQAQLDRVRRLGITPDMSPVVETQSGWDRQLMMETAREEIDNTAVLIQLIGHNPQEYLLMAARPEEEDIRRLGPDLIQHLQLKMKTMNSRWEDYERMFTTPNW